MDSCLVAWVNGGVEIMTVTQLGGMKMSKDLEERYNEGRLEGMFAASEVFETQIRKLQNSIEDVWNIHDHANSLDSSAEDHKQKLVFALHTLFVLREMFEGGYDEQLYEIKAALRNYDDSF